MHLNYELISIILVLGLLIIAVSDNLIKKIIGLGIFQTAIILFFVSISYIKGGIPPFLYCPEGEKCAEILVNPLPHVLMLTAIVVGIATLSVGLAIIIRIDKNFKTINESELLKKLEQKND